MLVTNLHDDYNQTTVCQFSFSDKIIIKLRVHMVSLNYVVH